MSAKILVADDSQTIQKVVGITLADSDYEIEQCLNEAELHQKLKGDQYSLVLLDFNLSESKSGYALVSEVKNISPSSSVMLMLGTFDTVDEERCWEVGVDDSIVKPFESAKFIQKCTELIEKSEPAPSQPSLEVEEGQGDKNDEGEAKEEAHESSHDKEELGEGWVVDAPDFEKQEVTAEKPVLETASATSEADAGSKNLQDEIREWGMEVPDVIGKGDSDHSEMPPIIEEASSSQKSSSVQEDEENDEDFLADIDDLKDSDEEMEQESSKTEIDLEQEEGVEVSELVEKEEKPEEVKEEELQKEVEEELSPDEFWAIDENLPKENQQEASPKTPEVGDEPLLESPSVEEEVVAKEKEIEKLSGASQIDEEKIVNDLVAKLSPIIEEKIEKRLQGQMEEMARKFSEEKVENIAWDVIPDLAENLIKKEIKEISDSLESS